MTALNLFPIGQLDGGHIAYALLGRRARLLSGLMIGLLVVMGVVFHLTWLFLAVLILVLELRSKMASATRPFSTRARRSAGKERVLAFVIVAIFVLSFVPEPVRGVGLLDLIKGQAGGF